MENTKANVDAFSAEVDEIKKYILDRSIKKIDNILKKTLKIRKMTAEFYGRIDNMLPPKTTAEQEQNTKKIDDFQRGIGKRWGEIWLEKEEIFTTIDVLYKLSENLKKYPNHKELEISSWTDIRRDIENRMKKILCD